MNLLALLLQRSWKNVLSHFGKNGYKVGDYNTRWDGKEAYMVRVSIPKILKNFILKMHRIIFIGKLAI